MDASLEYLLSYLEEEFRSFPEVRVRVVQPSGTLRSPDLEQDYDPESNDLHRRQGVNVRVRSREYFFPSEWVASGRYSEISRLAAEIRGSLE